MLDCSNYIPEGTIYKAQFSILKIAMIRINDLIEVCYGIKKPEFTYDTDEFDLLKTSSVFKKIQSNLENKKKTLNSLYRTAYLNL
jgi:hypothetical protein